LGSCDGQPRPDPRPFRYLDGLSFRNSPFFPSCSSSSSKGPKTDNSINLDYTQLQLLLACGKRVIATTPVLSLAVKETSCLAWPGAEPRCHLPNSGDKGNPLNSRPATISHACLREKVTVRAQYRTRGPGLSIHTCRPFLSVLQSISLQFLPQK